MTIIHIVLFKFRPDVSQEHKQTFMNEVRRLKHLPSVKDGLLLVGGPSVTEPIQRSKGFEISLVSYHEDRQDLAQYQSSDEHHRVTSTYIFPYKEDLIRFDFEVDSNDEYMCSFTATALV